MIDYIITSYGKNYNTYLNLFKILFTFVEKRSIINFMMLEALNFIFLEVYHMQAGRLTLLERLEYRSQTGSTTAELNLYPRQAKKLNDEGFSLKKISPVYGRYGQHRYHISWREAVVNTTAYNLLMVAVENNEQLREEIASETVAPIKPPYNYS